MSDFLDAATLVFEPGTLLVLLAASIYGLFVGATPGLTATMATALLVPITFFMPPVAAIGAIVTCSAMAIFAGDIPGALLRMPGTPASAAYVEDTYQLNMQGRVDLALGSNVTASAIGGLIGSAILIIGAPVMARWALAFSTFEYFWLSLLGLSCAAIVSGGHPLKGVISLALGLFLSTIGLDIISGQPRFTMGLIELSGGVSLVATMIGAFAVSEIMRRATLREEPLPTVTKIKGGVLRGQVPLLWKHRTGLVRGSITGTVVGALPGAGADIAAWISFAVSKRFSKTPEKYGTGHVEGIIEASASNNAALSGAYIPALVFGIPGDAVTAIVVGVLIMKGLTPGPLVFTTSPELINAIYIVFILANIIMVPLGIAAIYLGRRILSVPAGMLYPLILLFCVIGAFATNNTLFDCWTILVVGVCVWLMEANDYPVPPLILGLVLGRIVEENFIASMVKTQGSFLGFFERPLSMVLGVLTMLIWVSPLLLGLLRKSRREGSRA